ncbi:uncharacterized protein LOC127734113 isoform X2 [Mytilus californianus]|uniref:uncharacterized protein LOC127734113 isoform X2 n=1 Tax=Mytilus californianus TaxID=6549 RepID=UPI002245A6DC|nr:uncharacterized protein LOC127734113 isoform X2 [Mytilus californianus]
MEKPVCKSECNDNGDCSDDDANKGSDDAVNVVKSLKHTPEIHTALPNKINYICIGTMVSVVGIVLTVVVSVTMLVVISTDDKQNGFQLSNAILKISNQLDNLSIKMKSDSSTTDEPQTCENINTSYLYYVMQEENKRLKAELQKTKFRKDSIEFTDANEKRMQRTERQEQLRVDCRLVSSTNKLYGWVFGNKSLTFGRRDNFNINIKIKLLYPEIPDNDKILFEFGLTTTIDYLIWDRQGIMFRGQRCVKKPGICLDVIDNALSKLEGPIFEQMADYIQGQLTLELHKSHFVLMCNHRNIYISNVLNVSSEEKLWPVFGFYNTHLITISQTIFSENKISFNRTTVDPHLFVSEDNNTISNYKLQNSSGWDMSIMYLEIAFLIMSTVFILLVILKFENNILGNILVSAAVFLSVLLSIYYIYMNWSLRLLLIVSILLGTVRIDLRNMKFESNIKDYTFLSILCSTYIMSFFKAIGYIFNLIFY